MFTVGIYQVSFSKCFSFTLSRDRGRIDTICEISYKPPNSNISIYIYRGRAYLHPKDRPNKIIGKKIALTKALMDMRADKNTRTVFWKAFWEWVESWKSRKHNFAEGELAFCKICKAGEGELTTECCGRKMTEEERDGVYKIGNLDFINGKWTEKETKTKDV